MHVSDFDFELPAELIAQTAVERGRSRMLCLDRASGATAHAMIADLPAQFRPGDLLVVNNSKVFPARLIGRRLPGGGAAECLLVGRREEGVWEALVHPGQRLRDGSRMVFEREGLVLEAEVLARLFQGRRLVRLTPGAGMPPDIDAIVDRIGHVPLPPYIKRDDRPDDRGRYQTIWARARGSVAAPTAGLHFDEALLAALAARGVERAVVTLHVGYGTFKPVRVEQVEDHLVDAECYVIAPPAAEAIACARRERRRVIAVGTTTTRTLEGVASVNRGEVVAGEGSTDLFIHPGFAFQVISGLLTNFHVPRSSLLMLVSAFAGREAVLAAYREAVAARYRFYSYGDAMLIT